MASSVQEANVVRFGPFELDLRTSWLTRQGQPERLGLQPSRLLALLVQRRGELVTREELRSQLWPAETFVDFDHGLNNAVNRVREVLGDSPASPRYIQTVPRRGYRFIADVEVVEPVAPLEIDASFHAVDTIESSEAVPLPLVFAPARSIGSPPDHTDAVHATSPGRSRRWLVLLGGAIAIAAIAVALRIRKAPPVAPIRSLAVLPLQNLSGNPAEDYFVDGMTDALITELAHTPNLRVVSRTSVMQVKGSTKPLRQIAAELNVDAIVEGSVLRSGNRVRITAQLIDARNDRHLWAQSFEEPMGDVLTLEDKVVGEIASEAKIVLEPPPNESAEPRRVDPAAYDAYLRGLYFLHVRDAAKSTAYFREAISLDPSYPASYAGLAEALAGERVLATTRPPDTEAQAFAAARRGISLNPKSGEAYAGLGFVELVYRRDWLAAGRDLEKGLTLNPNNSIAELQYAIYLDAVDRPGDAVTQMRQALRIDPLSFTINRHLGSVLYFARQYGEALLYLHRADEMEPHNFRVVENWRSRTYEMLGRFDEAKQADLLVLGGWFPQSELAPLRLAFDRGGWKGYQAARINFLSSKTDNVCAPFEIGESYVRLGDRDQAFSWLRRGLDTSCFWANSLAVDPVLDGIRSDPRFPALLQQAASPAPRP